MRVAKKTKNKAGQQYRCSRCADPIIAGQEYFEWTFYRQKPTRQHASHGSPRQSQLTQSRMGQVYAAVETAEDEIAAARKTEDISGLADNLRTCAEEVENTRQEYEDGLGNMPDGLQQSSTGEAIQEKIDGLQEFHDSLDTAADEIETLAEEFSGLEEPGEDEGDEATATYESERERLRDEAFDSAENALGELSL